MSLLERDRPLAELSSAVERARDGRGSVVAVIGEAGIGKTSVLDELAHRVAGNVRVVRAGCEALFTPRPLGPLHDVAADLEIDPDAPRERLFPAVLAAAARVPTLLVVDDVHWADHATLDLVKYLSRRIAQAPLLLALSYRDDEIGPEHALITFLGEAGSALRRITLAPLSRDTVERLASGRAGVYELTGGNPFFVTELLAGELTGIPHAVRDAVLARAAKLPAAARNILEIASLVPGRAECWLLDAPDHAIDAATHSGIVRVENGAIVFRHELARQAIEASVSDLRRAQMHRGILTRLLAHGQASLARCAHHAIGARDAEAIVRFAPLAAAEATKAGAHREAEAHLRAALGAWTENDSARATLLESLSYECYLTEQHEEALIHRVEATNIRRRLGDTRLEGDNLRWQSRLNWYIGRSADARRCATEAIAILQQTPGHELAMACSNQSQLCFLAQEYELALTWGKRAIEMATNLGDHEVLAHALNNVGSAAVMANDPDGFEGLEESLRLSLHYGFQDHAARAYANLFSQSVRLRDHARAEKFLVEASQYFQERDLESWELYMIAWRARLHLEQGRWDEAAEDARAVVGRPGVSATSRMPALTVLGVTRMRRGKADAHAFLDEAFVLAVRSKEMQRIAPITLARAEAAWLTGTPPSAVQELRDALALADRIGWTVERADLELWLWRLGASDAAPAPGPVTGDPYDEALALQDRGDTVSLQRAVTILEELRDGCLVHILRQKLAALGVRGPRPSTRANPSGLTSREMEILALLDEGLRNADIAVRLHVSPKTVDHHVSSVLAKLGVRTRGEAARVFRSQK